MSINKFNHEGYYDPTVYQALTNIQAEQRALRRQHTDPQRPYRPMVFICSPYEDDILNSERKARVFSKFAVKQDTIPVTPHLLYPQFMNEDDPADRARALFFGLVLLGKCDQIWVFGNQITKGMAREIRKAQAKGIRVRYFTEDCKEVYHGPRT